MTGIRAAVAADFDSMLSIINAAARAYRGHIPSDCWHEPYMAEADLRHEMADGVQFWVLEEGHAIQGLMGIQHRDDVTLVRHAYTAPAAQGRGIGSRLLRHLETLSPRAMLIGTWEAAVWAIRFYQKHGYRVLATDEKDSLLCRYWSVPERQRASSVVLADARWSRSDEPGA